MPEVCWYTGQMFMHEPQRMQARAWTADRVTEDLGAAVVHKDQVEFLGAAPGVTPVHMEV